jgi:hypothetical protein
MDAAERESALTHTRDCSECATRLAEEKALVAGVRAVVVELSAQHSPAKVEAALLAAFRDQLVDRSVTAPAGVSKIYTQSRIWKLAAIAAAILILVLGALFLRQKSSQPAVIEEAVVTPTPSAPDETPIVSGEISSSEQAKARQPVLQRRRPRTPVNDVEVATEFMPLVEGQEVGSLENARIIRVELPGSALSALGFSGLPETTAEPVEAEVVLGHDGLARAIRFVR